ncbi:MULTISPECIES: Maf-like protein [unclassified Aminobacter]|uniref:Maf-like protein n=1 Tax=unclassified Aminobacter TaxID=2644704 RepID=UPI000464705A|nr:MULTISPECIES: Maf-like protein [unclassified Aminobacter]TWG50105.1 septum formation protein [Aminobacter sp. J44]TWH36372.1 septum formation protein [Aminobacter sp. J15]
MSDAIVLASGSPFRKKMLADAGLDFIQDRPQIDERAVEKAVEGSGLTPEDLASILAEAKALDVSQRQPGKIVIGTDQTLSLGDEVLHKPKDMEEARRRLLALSGKTHQLNSAIVLVRDGEVLWRHVGIARLTMRQLDPGFIGRHLSRVGDKALSSVGAYQIEGEGIQLFESIKGDHFTIVGLPLLPLLDQLRHLGAIDG